MKHILWTAGRLLLLALIVALGIVLIHIAALHFYPLNNLE